MINLLIIFLWLLCAISIPVSFVNPDLDKDVVLLLCFVTATLGAYKAHQEMWK